MSTYEDKQNVMRCVRALRVDKNNKNAALYLAAYSEDEVNRIVAEMEPEGSPAREEEAHVLCVNDFPECVVLGGTEAQREAYLLERKARHCEETTRALGKSDIRVQHYGNVYYWHYHTVRIERLS